jgi:hypothetical protein
MEYLMTYGWAILIIAVVLGALFQLGVFGGGNLIGSSCIAAPGFYCQNAAIRNTATANGLAFVFGQNLGISIYNIAMACAATSNSQGYPSGAAFNDIGTNGGWLPTLGTQGTSLASGATLSIGGGGVTANNIPCIGNNGKPVGFGSPVGTSFTGYIWMNYTTSSGIPEPNSNPWYTVKIATLNTKVT